MLALVAGRDCKVLLAQCLLPQFIQRFKSLHKICSGRILQQ